MAKKYPWETLYRIAGDKTNYELQADYLISKKLTREVPKCYNSGDDVKRDLQTIYCVARRKLCDTELHLKAARSYAAKKRIALDEQWQELAAKEDELRQNFISFSSFITKNQEKSQRAEAKIHEMNNLKDMRDKDNAHLSEKLEQLYKTKVLMDEAIKSYQIYKKYLDSVLEAYPTQFKALPDILNRYEALVEAREQLQQLHEYHLQNLEQAKAKFGKLIEEKNFVIMGLNNQIASLQARFEHAYIKSLESENLVLQIKNNAMKQMEEINMVKTSVWNLYTIMAQTKKQPIKIRKDDVEEQLLYIKRTLTELSKVNQLLKKHARLAKSKKMKDEKRSLT